MRLALPNRFAPRRYQVPFMRYFDGGGRHGFWVLHRRGGKDLTAMHQACKMMHERRGAYWHVFPTAEQGRKAIWTGFTKSGERIMEQVFPLAIRKKPREWTAEQEMVVELRCGSIYRLIGSDKMNNVGAGPCGVIFSEFSQAKPSSRSFILPMLAESEGWEAIITTPRGHNHAYELWKKVRTDPAWFTDLKTLRETGAYGYERTIAEAKANGMEDALIRQEYDCDWNAALVGSIWGPQVEALEASGAVGQDFVHETDGVFVIFDLGISDSTAMWFARLRRDEATRSWGVDFIDYYEAAGQPMSHYFDELDKRGYRYEKFWLPHDARARTLATGVSILDLFSAECRQKRWGEAAVAIGPELSLLDGIQAGRWLLQQSVRFHARCAEGVEALRQYHYEYDEDRHTYSTRPEHDWSSHCFTAETEVLTRHGRRRLDMLPSAGEVLTPCGWRPYRNPRKTRTNAPLVEVRFEDGLSVRCTPEHLFLTVEGWRSAESLRPGSQIQSSLTRLRSISMAASTVSGRVSAILRGAAQSFTAMSGLSPSVLSLAGATFTTETRTQPTTGSRTWNASRPQNTSRGLGAIIAGNCLSTFQSWLARRPASGTALMPEGSGTAATRSGPRRGRSGRGRSEPAGTAGKPSSPSFGPMGGLQNGAPRSARPLRIVASEPLGLVADVWDITVPGAECFALANGATVYNSADAYRYTAIVVKVSELLTRKAAPPKPLVVNTVRPTLDELWKSAPRPYRERIG